MTFDDLWYGNINSLEKFIDGNEKLKELLPIMAKDIKNLPADFSPEQVKWLEKYDDIINEMHSNSEVEAFMYGFRLATALFIESTAKQH